MLEARSDLEEWPLNVRVGANSPSLCPTMFSVMNSGTWRLPSCTAMVKPSMSGMIVDARDQVRITTLVLLRLAWSTFFASFS